MKRNDFLLMSLEVISSWVLPSTVKNEEGAAVAHSSLLEKPMALIDHLNPQRQFKLPKTSPTSFFPLQICCKQTNYQHSSVNHLYLKLKELKPTLPWPFGTLVCSVSSLYRINGILLSQQHVPSSLGPFWATNKEIQTQSNIANKDKLSHSSQNVK